MHTDAPPMIHRTVRKIFNNKKTFVGENRNRPSQRADNINKNTYNIISGSKIVVADEKSVIRNEKRTKKYVSSNIYFERRLQ